MTLARRMGQSANHVSRFAAGLLAALTAGNGHKKPAAAGAGARGVGLRPATVAPSASRSSISSASRRF